MINRQKLIIHLCDIATNGEGYWERRDALRDAQIEYNREFILLGENKSLKNAVNKAKLSLKG